LSVPNTAFKEPGLILYKKFGAYPQIIGIREGSPAAGSDLNIGEYISAIDDRSTLIMSLQEVNLLLKSVSDEPIRLQILRPTKTEEISLERRSLTEDSVSFIPLKNTFGILRIHHLFSPCVVKTREELQKRLPSSGKPLVLDMRNCFEGQVEEAVKLINLFIREEKIGYFSNKNGPTQYLSCADEPEFKDLALVVWTNRATFGSAEIAVAVLQDLGRARIIGQKTPGLPGRQRLFTLEDGSGLLLTTEVFHLASGEPVWQKGVQPEIKIRAEDLTSDSYVKETYSLIRDM
jgi:C-terminal peptidase prc